MSSSSRVFRLPPMSARWREPATGFTPEKEGLPRRTIRSTAAVVSLSRWATSSRLVSGRRRRARSFPSWVTAWSASRSRTRGSSKVSIDFSNRSVMGSLLTSRFPLRGGGWETPPAQPVCTGRAFPMSYLGRRL